MKFKRCYWHFTFFLLALFVTVATAQDNDHGMRQRRSTSPAISCAEGNERGQEPVLFYRYYHSSRVNHHYRISYSDDINKQLLAWGYTNEGVAGKVYKNPATGTAPLYRYYHGANMDHFYTTDWKELGAGKGGYKYEGIECYIFPNPMDGTTPLYRYWHPTAHDHFYTTNWNELKDGKDGWKHEGIAGYIFPAAAA